MSKQITNYEVNGLSPQILEEHFLVILGKNKKTTTEINSLADILNKKVISKDTLNQGINKIVELDDHNHNCTLLDWLLTKAQEDINLDAKYSALNNAIRAHNIKAIQVLLDNGVDPKCNLTKAFNELPLVVAISAKNHDAYSLLEKKGVIESDYLNSDQKESYLFQAVKDSNGTVIKHLLTKYGNKSQANVDNLQKGILQLLTECPVKNLLTKYGNELQSGVDGLIVLNFQKLNENILESLGECGIKIASLEKTFLQIISYNTGMNGLDKFLIDKGLDVKKAFDNYPSKINWNGQLTRDYAVKINSKYSEFLEILNKQENATIDECKKCFYQAKEFKSTNKDDLHIEKIMKYVFKKPAIFIQQLISEIARETPQDQHKDLVKWLTLFGAKFSFYTLDYNTKKILLTSQDRGNESEAYPKDFDGSKYTHSKKMTKVEIIDGKLCNAYTGNIISSENNSYLYVIDKKGQLYVDVYDYILRHSFVLNGLNQKHDLSGISMRCYGKPIQLGGTMFLKDGLIIKVINDSGHYTPNLDMLKQGCKLLDNLGVLSEKVKINKLVSASKENPYGVEEVSLQDVRNFNAEEVVASGDYPYIDYFN